MNYRNRNDRLLAALRYFDNPLDPKPMDGAPKGVGWSTIHDLEEAGLLAPAGTATSIRGKPFLTTPAGRVVLDSENPANGLPPLIRWQDRGSDSTFPKTTSETSPVPEPHVPRDRARTAILAYPPRGMDRIAAARYVGVSVSKFDEMVRDRRMPEPKKVDRRNVWDRIELDAFFTDLPSRENSNEEGASGEDWIATL